MRAIRRTVVLAAALLAAAPACSQAFDKAIWGPVSRGGVSQFPLYHKLGVTLYEADLSWRDIAAARPRDATNPNDPAYRWPAEISRALSQAARFHMRVMLQLIGSPRWANGGRSWKWAPRRAADYAAFAAAAARRYPSVHLWMIWGEPTKRFNFQPLTTVAPGIELNRAQRVAPHIYARMLDEAYAALKAVSASNLVIGGCTYTTGDVDTFQWITNLRLPDGHAPRMDMYAHNPFSYTDPSFSVGPSPFEEVQFSDLPRLAQWVDRYLHRGLPLFLSEWTIPTAVDNEFGFYVDPPVAAKWINDALALARGWRRIYALGWVHVYDDPPASRGGLLDEQGVPKPGFQAFARG
jgi:hypothetical protein